MRISMNFGLCSAALLFAVLFVPTTGWASQSNNCPTEPRQNVPIVSGQTYYGSNCAISHTGDVDSFQFNGAVGSSFSIVGGLGPSPTTDICLSLYAPGLSSTPVSSSCTGVEAVFPYYSTVINYKLQANGTYTIAVTETTNTAVSYALSLEQINPPPSDAVPLVLNQNQTYGISPPTAQDAFTFYGATTGTYEITASVSSSASNDICFEVFQPDGTNVVQATCTGVEAVFPFYSVSADLTPTANGTYVVVADVSGNDATLGYTFEVSCLLGTCPRGPSPSPFIPVAGALSQISVGADGSVWGINSSQQIFTYNSANQSWTNIPGSLTQIAVGSSTAVWGVNANGQIYFWDLVHSQWTNIPGSLAQIAVGADGDVWGLNSASFIYHYNAQSGFWKQVPGQLAHIVVGSAGAVYGINSAGGTFWYNPGTGYFQYLGGPAFSQIAVGVDGSFGGISNGAVYGYYRGAWDALGNNFAAAQIALGTGASAYALDASGNIYFANGGAAAWNQIAGTLSSISVGSDGAVWGLNSAQEIFTLQNAPMRAYQTLTSVSGSVNHISVGADGSVWALSGTTVETFNPIPQSFEAVPGAPALAQVSAGAGGNVWALDTSGNIYQFDPVSTTFTNIPGQLTFIQVAANGAVWGINSAGQTYTYSNNGWTNIPGTLASLSVGADGTVWGLNAQQQVYRFDGGSQSWVNVPGSLVQIAVGNAANVWGINAQGEVYYYDNARGWVIIPGAYLTDISVAFDGSVWGVNAAGSLYQWNASTTSFNFVGSGVTNVSVGNAAAVWAFNRNSGAVFSWF